MSTQALSTSDPAPLVGDPDQLRQVVNNLIGNAVAHAPEGAIEVAVTSDSDDRQSGGAGLGLAIVAGVAEAHGGSVRGQRRRRRRPLRGGISEVTRSRTARRAGSRAGV